MINQAGRIVRKYRSRVELDDINGNRGTAGVQAKGFELKDKAAST